jgi:hypothetical protein
MIDEERKQIEEHVAHNSQVKSKIIKGGECERSKKMKFNAIAKHISQIFSKCMTRK